MAKMKELGAWARIGAESRLEALRAEESSILRAFPELGGASRGSGASRVVRSVQPTMSAARRRQVSERMKRYWSERRAKKGKGA